MAVARAIVPAVAGAELPMYSPQADREPRRLGVPSGRFTAHGQLISSETGPAQ